jgi:hypothetical protein
VGVRACLDAASARNRTPDPRSSALSLGRYNDPAVSAQVINA